MADDTGVATRNASWDGTSRSGVKTTVKRAPDEGSMSPPIRGTATSSLQGNEEDFIRRTDGTDPQPNRGMWPYTGASSNISDADAQGQVDSSAAGPAPSTKPVT